MRRNNALKHNFLRRGWNDGERERSAGGDLRWVGVSRHNGRLSAEIPDPVSHPPDSHFDSATVKVRLPTAVLRTRLWQLALALIGVGALAWWWSGHMAHDQMAEECTLQSRDAQVEVGGLAGHVSLRLGQVRSLTEILAQDPGVVSALARFGPDVPPSALPLPQRQALWSGDGDLAVLTNRFQGHLDGFRLRTLWVSNAAGDAVLEAHAEGVNPFLGANYAERDYFKTARQGANGHQFAVGKVTNLMSLFLAAPVMKNGVFLGMVGANIGVDEFSPLLQDMRGFLTDDHGVVILAQNPEWLMRTLPQATVSELSPQARLSRYKREQFEPLGLAPAAGQGCAGWYSLPGVDGPQMLGTKFADGGFLQVHTLRSQTKVLAIQQADRWWWLGALASSGSLLACLLAGGALFLDSSRRQARVLQRLNSRLARQANTDALTSIPNRRRFLQVLELELARSQRHRLPLCVLSLDIDHFKRVNDTHGHAAGDTVLKHFAEVIQTQLRLTDVFGRLGGEEFSVMLPQTTAEGGRLMAQRLRLAVEARSVRVDGRDVRITVSIGGVQWNAQEPLSIQDLLIRCDDALYAAKMAWRNRLMWFHPVEMVPSERGDLPSAG